MYDSGQMCSERRVASKSGMQSLPLPYSQHHDAIPAVEILQLVAVSLASFIRVTRLRITLPQYTLPS